MRVLVITQKWNYLNPTLPLLTRELANRPEVVVTGWGYGDRFTRMADLTRKYGSFDVAIVDPWVLTKGGEEFYANCRPADLLEAGIPLILNLVMQDIHNLSAEFFRTVVDKCQFVLSTVASPQFWKACFDFERESWLKPSFTTTSPELINDRFLLIPHAVGEHEFASVERRRPWDVGVEGVRYHFRSKAIDVLSRSADLRCKLKTGRLHRVAARLATDYYSGRYLGTVLLAQWLFRRSLRRSLCGITCEGSIGYPIRKFFEIPAAGAVLIARPFEQPEALGFRHRDTAILVDDADLYRLGEIVLWLKSDSVESRALATRGQEMVREFHTVSRRVDQILEIAAAIATGKMTGMSWHHARPKLDLSHGPNEARFGES